MLACVLEEKSRDDERRRTKLVSGFLENSSLAVQP